MIRRERTTNGVRLVSDDGPTIDISLRAPGVIFVRPAGAPGEEFGVAICEEIRALVEKNAPVQLFNDSLDTSVAYGARAKLSDYIKTVPHKVTGLHVLTNNPLAGMVAAAARLIFGARLHVYTDREAFARAMDDARRDR
jgi:hypothetical protein